MCILGKIQHIRVGTEIVAPMVALRSFKILRVLLEKIRHFTQGILVLVHVLLVFLFMHLKVHKYSII